MGVNASVRQQKYMAIDKLRERKFEKTKIPGNEKAGQWKRHERIGQGARRPRSESSREQIGQGPTGRFALGSELDQ